jgi:ATP-dependent DNA ligase
MIEPMLCRSTRAVPAGSGWRAEPKYDGWRMLFAVDSGEVRVWTRRGRPHHGRLPYIEEQLCERVPDDTILDGEIVALCERPGGGVACDFEALMPIFAADGPHHPAPGDSGLYLIAFDLIRFAGSDLRTRPWNERRAMLERLLSQRSANVSLAPGAAATRTAHEGHLASGMEGTVFKREDSAYRSGERGWLKLKSRHRREVTVGWARVHRKGEVRVGCRDAETAAELGHAVVWNGALRTDLADDPAALEGRRATVEFTSLTPRGRMREARIVATG